MAGFKQTLGQNLNRLISIAYVAIGFRQQRVVKLTDIKYLFFSRPINPAFRIFRDKNRIC